MAFCGIDKRFCVGCSFRTIEKKQFRPKTNSKCHQKSLLTLKCSICRKELCYDCVRNLRSSIGPMQHLLHDDCNDFVQGLQEYEASNGKVTPEGYIGHCCLIKRHYPDAKERKENVRNQQTKIILNREDLPDELIPKYFESPSPTRPHIGGSMCLPEYKLLLPSDENSMDILGLGKEEKYLKAKWHYVIDEDWAQRKEIRDVHPSKTMPNNWKSTTVKLKVPIPHSLKDAKTTQTVRVFYVPKVQDVDSKLKGCNKISAHDLSSSYYFDASLGVSNDVDVTVVIGIDTMDQPENFGSILLMRFHKLRPTFKKKDTDGCTKTFLSRLQKELSNGGLERRRVGGSSGKITYARDVKLLLATPNSTPRCSSGAVWLRDKSDLKWHVFYLGTKDGEQKYTYYTTPRQGGSFNMPPELYTTYPFLMDFASTKPLAANILIALQESLKHKANIPNVNVCPVAVDEEIKNMKAARSFVLSFIKKHPRPFYQQKILFYQFYSANFLNYTLVMHPVGRHLDVFADNKPSLENRICFSFKLKRDGTSGLKNTGYKYGRGGCGLHRFCFALLDWNSPNRIRRRAWTDPNNANLPHSATDYANRNGHGNQRLNVGIWTNFAMNGNAIRLPQNVTLASLEYNGGR